MINKNNLMKKLKKNRVLILIISVIVITGVYYGVEKAIDSYNFRNNSDIVESLEAESTEDAVNYDSNSKVKEENTNKTGKVPEEEVDLELGEEIIDLKEAIGKEVEEDLDVKQGQEGSFSEEKIYVYITGEVNVPGVVILNKGSRIVDAINAAGGTTAKADVSRVNLVYVLEDGMKVNIPNSNELKNNPNFEYITMNSGDGKQNGDSGHSNSNSSSNSGSNSGSGSSRDYSVVNINNATQTELESLPGIGPSLALKIINYRKENGKFSSIEEIKSVSGIGESKFESLKKYIVV